MLRLVLGLVMIHEIYRDATAQTILVSRVNSTNAHCTVGKPNTHLMYRGAVIIYKSVTCESSLSEHKENRQEPVPQARLQHWWQRLCLHTAKNPNHAWNTIMCKNITLGNCKDFDQTFFFCDSVYTPNITNTRFRLTIRPEPKYSLQFVRINFEYADQCHLYKDVVFQLPQMFGSPFAYLVLNDNVDIVLDTSRNCSVQVQPGELNKFTLCVNNMLQPTLNVTIQYVLSITAKETCVQAVATFSVRQLPSSIYFRAVDLCEEDVVYYCNIQLEPSIKLYVNKVEVYITKRTNTCSFFVKNQQWNTVNICVGHFMSYILGIRYETRFLQLAPESFTCVTIEFVARSPSQLFEVKVKDSQNIYLTVFTCRYYKI